jgi:hypothetical protein
VHREEKQLAQLKHQATKCEETIWRLQQELAALDCMMMMMMMTVPVLVPGSELHFMAVCRTLFHLAVFWSELIKLLNMKNSWNVPFLCVCVCVCE